MVETSRSFDKETEAAQGEDKEEEIRYAYFRRLLREKEGDREDRRSEEYRDEADEENEARRREREEALQTEDMDLLDRFEDRRFSWRDENEDFLEDAAARRLGGGDGEKRRRFPRTLARGSLDGAAERLEEAEGELCENRNSCRSFFLRFVEWETLFFFVRSMESSAFSFFRLSSHYARIQPF